MSHMWIVKLFGFTKSQQKDYCGVPTLQKDGVRHDDNQVKASILNFFSTVFTNDGHLKSSQDLGPSLYSDVPNIGICCEGITRLLSDLDPTKYHSPDEVPARFLKFLALLVWNWFFLLLFIRVSSHRFGNKPL